jgi:Xaa-Pro aminopeptidase
VIASRGFGALFRHSTGHGVGFAAIDAGAQPRLHPASPDVLLKGMVCNVEPAIYIDGYGGIRHCDVVAVTESGCAVLTPFHTELDDLVINAGADPFSRRAPSFGPKA